MASSHIPIHSKEDREWKHMVNRSWKGNINVLGPKCCNSLGTKTKENFPFAVVTKRLGTKFGFGHVRHPSHLGMENRGIRTGSCDSMVLFRPPTCDDHLPLLLSHTNTLIFKIFCCQCYHHVDLWPSSTPPLAKLLLGPTTTI